MELRGFSTKELDKAQRRLNQKYFSGKAAHPNKQLLGVWPYTARIACWACFSGSKAISDGRGIDRLADAADPLDFPAAFDQLRQPLYAARFYHEQWLALSALARSRGENDGAFLKQIGEFLAPFGR